MSQEPKNVAQQLYQKSKKIASEQMQLFHFTKLKVLKIILETKKLRLSNLDKVNDPKELKYIDNIWKKKIFIISFTDYIRDYMWNQYANGADGICIEFTGLFNNLFDVCSEDGYKYDHIDQTKFSHKSYQIDEDWGVRAIDYLKVFYFDDPENNKVYDEELINIFKELVPEQELLKSFSSMNGQGFVKEKIWELESEYRVRVAMRPKGQETHSSLYQATPIYHHPPFEYVFLNIENYNFDKLKIWVSDDFKEMGGLIEFQKQYHFQIELYELGLQQPKKIHKEVKA